MNISKRQLRKRSKAIESDRNDRKSLLVVIQIECGLG